MPKETIKVIYNYGEDNFKDIIGKIVKTKLLLDDKDKELQYNKNNHITTIHKQEI
ncbi:hypothetical protein [Clostridium sp. C8-1-8]|uniref:hypothetical protein n=1 Tax=Clostridium sp. C8-1-8 TaxID=2698831 RepID=UPI00136AA92C|nr:hypothetical protein [Clostridium sp. C8-1-8]